MSTNQLIRCELHPEEEARLTCGECKKRICTVCMTLTGEGPRCQGCMVLIETGFQSPPAPAQAVAGTVLPAGDEMARADGAKQAYYATESPVIYCARHPQTETLLTCGRCGVPICPRCMVHAGVGIRCPDCAANPQRTIGVQAEQAAARARGKEPPPDNGFRNYWYKNQAFQKVAPVHYLLAALAGFGVAVGLGLLWGFLMEANYRPRGGRLTEADLLREGAQGLTFWTQLIGRSVRASIHLLPEIFLGVVVGEAISRITRHRVGPGLQVIGGLAVGLGIVVSTITVGARIYQGVSGQLPAPGALFNQSLSAIGLQLGGDGLGVLIFWAIGIAFAVIRLKR